jgi:hypothetical protein
MRDDQIANSLVNTLVSNTASNSVVVRPISAPETGSYRLWGLDFERVLPQLEIQRSARVDVTTLDVVLSFLQREFPTLLGARSGVVQTPQSITARHRYLQYDSDLLEISSAGQVIAVFVGAPEDWSSYYARMFAVHPRFQQRGLIRRFVRECLFAPLIAHGVERFVADTSPVNIAMLRMFAELKFQPTGHLLTERWGPLVRHTKFLDPSCESAFCARFAVGAPPT